MKKILNLLISLFRSKVDFNNRIEYRNKLGQLHRTDGPAIEHNSGYKSWYINGQRHRLDGPSIEFADGTKEWWINDKRHREDGPAIEWKNGPKSWYLNNIKYSEEQFHQEIIKLKLKRLIEL